MTNESELDSVDTGILDILQHDSSTSNVEIGRRVGVSPPTVHTRIKRLTTLGYIEGYYARLKPQKLGYDLRCVLHINLQTHTPEDVYYFREQVSQMPEVLDAYQITGAYDYLLIILAKNQQDLNRFLMERLTPFECVARIQTSIVLNEVKTSTAVPLD